MATFMRVISAAAMVLMTSAAAGAQGAARNEADLIRSRQAISTMEAVLQRAVSNGAEMVMAQIRNVMPTDRPRLSMSPRVSGFRLDGTGIIFHVHVPGLDLPITWDLLVQNNLGRDNGSAEVYLRQLRMQVLGMPPGPAKAQLLDQIDAQLSAAAQRADARNGISAASLPAPTAERVGAVDTAKVDSLIVDDPEAAYTREVKNALIEAMLVNSQPLSVAPDEWLVIVARDGVPSNPLLPGDSIDASTWVMRVKGNVLAALRAGTITKDEARKEVEVKEQ